MVCAVLCADLWKLWEIPSIIGRGLLLRLVLHAKLACHIADVGISDPILCFDLNLLNWYIVGTLGC